MAATDSTTSTAAATRCNLTELLTSDCAHCRCTPDLPQRHLGEPFPAVWPGRCYDCRQPYAAGEPIRRVVEDGIPGWVATCCAEQALHG